jgi:alpha-amylase/alpha-mannosidase (GH57 family)
MHPAGGYRRMNRVHLVILWHMHQPQYRDPSNGRYVLPWTRLHALKDYWGMVKMLEEFPNVHATFNLVPSLAAQLEEYASGRFDEPWFQIAFAPADSLTLEDKREVLVRAFQLNHDNLLSRWPRFRELFDWVRSAGVDAAATQIGLRDLRDLQLLSQLAWMDEEYLANDPVVSALVRKAADFTERDKDQLRAKQIELLGRVIPEYRRGSERGQIEISTTPYYHPILPLVCDTDIARIANSWTPLPNPPFRYPQDAREQLVRARALHERMIGQPPVGLWPSEGSVSDQALGIAAELGFRWFATDEGVLGRTLNISFWRDAAGFPECAAQLYSPWRIRREGRDIVGLFRDHYLSDLVGFVYSRMDASGAAYDLHHRIRAAGERIHGPRPVTVCLILDGENAWEYYPGNGREFLRQFYRNIQNDPDIRALTASEAIAAAGEIPVLEGIFPASWINANFDVWIGHNEDVQAWNLLRDAREEYEKEAQRRAANEPNAVSEKQLAKAFESVLAAEGSDWCWWYGPENSSANDAEFDALYRKHLTEIYLALGREAPESLAQPIKTGAEGARLILPSAYLDINVDGRETSFFEWLGAGIYTSDQRQGAMHGRVYFMETLFYGFAEDRFFVRVDLFPEGRAVLRDCEFRVTIHAAEEIRVSIRVLEGRVIGFVVEHDDVCRLNPRDKVSIALDKILEVSIKRDVVPIKGCSFRFGVALWQGGLPIDLLPGEGSFEIQLGEELFAWPVS